MNMGLRQANESDEHQVDMDAPRHTCSKKKVVTRRQQSMRKLASTDVLLLVKIKEALARTVALHDVLGELLPGAHFDAVEKKLAARYHEITQLEAQIPDPPKSITDLLSRAEIARFGADLDKNGEIAELTSQGVFQGPSARLIDAVIQFGKCGTSDK